MIPIHRFALGILPRLFKEVELPQGFALGLDWDRFVAAGGVDRNMAQPLLHNRDVDAGETQMGGRGVTPEMNGTNLFTFDALLLAGSLGQVSTAEPEKTGARQAGTALVDKKEVPETRQRDAPLRLQIGAQEGRRGVP